LQHNKQRI